MEDHIAGSDRSAAALEPAGLAPPTSVAERLFALSLDLLCVLEPTGRVRHVNPAFLRAVGWTMDELVARPWIDFVHPDEYDAMRETVRTHLATPRSADCITAVTNRFRCRDGSYRAIAWRASPPDEQGLSYAVGRDVTEDQRSAAALRESEAMLRETQAIARIGSWSRDLRAGRTTWSDELYRLYGLEPGAAVPSQELFLSIVHPDDRPRVEARIRETVQAGSSFAHDYRIVRPDGTLRHVHGRGRTVPDERGVPARLVGSSQDITERVRGEEALRASEERFRAVYEKAGIGIAVADPAGCYEEANAAFCEMLGYSEPELLGRHINEVTEPEDRPTQTERVSALLEGQQRGYTLEKRYRRKDDTSLWARATVSMIQDHGGAPQHLIAVVEDISERKRTEEALREREAQLQQAVKMEALGRLAGGVAHDFNNLLTVILSYGAFLEADLPVDSAARADVLEMTAAARRAADLTKQLLAFGRKQLLQPRLVDVNEAVTSTVGMLRRVLGEDIALATELASDSWPVFADPGQLGQVLMNLAVNARDAMPDGGTLCLRTANVQLDERRRGLAPGLAPGEYVVIEVEDTGTGIAPSALPLLFEPFFTTKGQGKGTGLGLATVYGIVQQSGGRITVDSTLGRGSRFTVFLPRARVATDARCSDAAADAIPGGRETILLVEDEAAARTAIRRMLERQGYTVREAAGCTEALAVIEREEKGPDLVLTDVVMPEQNGRALGEQVGRRWPRIPVLYMSGYMEDSILRQGLAGASATLLEKPFTPDRLAHAVRRALDRRAAAAE